MTSDKVAELLVHLGRPSDDQLKYRIASFGLSDDEYDYFISVAKSGNSPVHEFLIDGLWSLNRGKAYVFARIAPFCETIELSFKENGTSRNRSQIQNVQRPKVEKLYEGLATGNWNSDKSLRSDEEYDFFTSHLKATILRDLFYMLTKDTNLTRYGWIDTVIAPLVQNEKRIDENLREMALILSALESYTRTVDEFLSLIALVEDFPNSTFQIADFFNARKSFDVEACREYLTTTPAVSSGVL